MKWKERVKSNNIRVEDDGRYVDDARVFLFSIRAGWRLEQGGLWFKKEWEQEDSLLSPTERTKRVVYGSMQGLTKCLAFTVETSEDFADGWLPSLDFKLRVNKVFLLRKTHGIKQMSTGRHCSQPQLPDTISWE